MVRRVLNIMYREVRGLHQAAYILALFALGSQFLALIRDRLLAHQFGAGGELDIYYAAFRLPDLLFVLFASSLSVYVLIPFVAGNTEDDRSEKTGGELLSQVFSLFLVVYTIAALICFVTAPFLLPKIFPGISDQATLLTLTRVLLLQPLFLGVSGLFGVVTQLSHRFVLYAVSPLLYNFGIIIGIMALYPWLGLSGLSYGVVLGAFLHFCVQYPVIRDSVFKIRLTWRIDWKRLREVLALSIPRALTLSMQQIVLLVLLGLASAMAVGSVSIFQFAYNLQSVPLAIIGVSYSVAAFPVLSELYNRQARTEFALHIGTAIRHIIFWSVPAIALIVVLRAQIVRVVLGSGAFDWADTRLTAATLALLSLSLLAQSINLLVVRAFYAGGYTRLPLYVTLFGSFLAIVFSYGFLIFYNNHEGWHTAVSSLMRLDAVGGSEVLAIAFGYALSMLIQAVFLTWCMGRVFQINLSFVWRPLLSASFAALIGGLTAYASLNFLVEGIDQERFLGVLIQGFLSGVFGIFGAVIAYAALRSQELQEIYSAFHKRLSKRDVVAPPEEVI